MALILLRHTRVKAPAGTCYGWRDLPLAEPADPPFDQVLQALRGQLLALGTEAGLGGPLRLAQVHSSTLQRAALLARHIALQPEFELPVTLDARWRELGFGDWEGLHWNLIDRALSDPWAEDPVHRAPPGGETLAALAARVRAARDALHAAASRPGEAVLVVGHAGPMRVLLADALRQPLFPPVEQALDFGGLLVLQPLPGGGWAWPVGPARNESQGE